MATAITITPCFTCDKMKAMVKCEGCSKMYCINHFEDHRQELSKQLEEVEVTRDLFRQSLTEKITESQKHSFTAQIDEWENESIDKIRQAANEARQVLLKHAAELNTKMENKLNKLTNQLRQSREAKDFFEPDLNQWIEELTQMKDELVKSSIVTIRQDPTPFVTKINVDISSKIFNS
jgi:phosphoglycerate-specific signal transduction histidine kinase